MNYPKDRIEEEFNEIPGFEGHYSITWDGEVWSHWGNGKWMPVKFRGKYPYVVLGNERGYPEVHFIHNLMYTVFLGDVPDNAKVIHKDGNTLNNRIDNLELKFQKKREVKPEVTEKKEDKKIEDLTCERKASWEEVYEKYGVDFEWDKEEELRKTREFYYNGMQLFIPS